MCNTARQLGSSVGILSASIRLRQRLGRVLFLFQENAADLFPDEVSRGDSELRVRRKLTPKSARQEALEERVASHTPESNDLVLDLKPLSTEFEMFASDLSTLLECFSQFPEFVDEIPDQSLCADIKVCSCPKVPASISHVGVQVLGGVAERV